jgi:pyrroloquinoline quinone biosynthesis protein D
LLSKDFLWRNVNGEAVLLNPKDGSYFGLNSVGCSFWEKADGKRSLGEIIELLLEEYDVDRKHLEEDLLSLVSEMEKQNILISAQ